MHSEFNINQIINHPNIINTLIRPSSWPYDGIAMAVAQFLAIQCVVSILLFWVFLGLKVCLLFAARICSWFLYPAAFRGDSCPSLLWACSSCGRWTCQGGKTLLFRVCSACLKEFLNVNAFTCEVLERRIYLHLLALSLCPPFRGNSPENLQKLFEIQLPRVVNVHH